MNGSRAGVSLDLVAVITAALSAVIERDFVITNIQRGAAEQQVSNIWAKAGLLESHFARRQFGLRSR